MSQPFHRRSSFRCSNPALSARAAGAVCAFLYLSTATLSAAPRENAADVMRRYVEAVIPILPECVRTTLDKIPNAGRRMLAVAYYVRRIDEIDRGWSWTSEQVAAFRKTDEYDTMVSEIEKVRRHFSEQYRGYGLRVTVDARSLDVQTHKWNTVGSVGRATSDFIDSCGRVLEDSAAFPSTPDSLSVPRFIEFLETYSPLEGRIPTVAVPGLSKHGQLCAFDFKVVKGRRLVAGTSAASIPRQWEKPGWTLRLMFAVFDVSDRFEGPLDIPYEPWHYTISSPRSTCRICMRQGSPPNPPQSKAPRTKRRSAMGLRCPERKSAESACLQVGVGRQLRSIGVRGGGPGPEVVGVFRFPRN